MQRQDQEGKVEIKGILNVKLKSCLNYENKTPSSVIKYKKN